MTDAEEAAGGGAPEGGAAPAATVPSVRAVGLSRSFGDRKAVDRVDLEVHEGELFGFLGPNGAGKSTTIRMLCGMLRPTSGRAFVLGHDVVDEPLEVKRRVGVLPEEVNTYERLTGRELLVFTGRIHGLTRSVAQERADQLLDLVELSGDDRRRLVVDYSMGMRKKTVLACALIHNPRVLFLDEPFNGIDAVTTSALQKVLTRLVERGVTVFFSSHVLDVVERLCTRLAILHQGRVVACGTLDEIRTRAGHDPKSTLADVFVDLVGGRTEGGDLEWLG